MLSAIDLMRYGGNIARQAAFDALDRVLDDGLITPAQYSLIMEYWAKALEDKMSALKVAFEADKNWDR